MLKQSQCDCGDQAKRVWSMTVQSPAGGEVDLKDDANWTTEGTIRASFTSRGGNEHIQGNQVQGVINHTLETASTNFTRGILPRWRLVFQSRTIEITAAFDTNEERRMVQIQGTEKI